MKHVAAFSSQRDDWETPQRLYDELNAVYGFTLDAAAAPYNTKHHNYYSVNDDALSKPWPGTVWLNPPYSHGIGAWLRKAWEESRENADLVVCLIPARTETSWWHDYVMRARDVYLLRGRLRFSGSRTSAPFPSALVIFEKGYDGIATITTKEVSRS